MLSVFPKKTQKLILGQIKRNHRSIFKFTTHRDIRNYGPHNYFFKDFFFLMWTVFKSLICYNSVSVLCFGFWLGGMWDLNSLTWDLSNPGMEPSSLRSPALAGRFCTTSTTWDAFGGERGAVHTITVWS